MIRIRNLVLAASLVCQCGLLSAAGQTTEPDNSGINKRDRDKSQPTADQQKENASDRELAKNVRHAITSDKGLSTYAHNVKVIVQDGAVTLRGPVRSDEEKRALEAKVTSVAGVRNVTNQLDVKGDKSGEKSDREQD